MSMSAVLSYIDDYWPRIIRITRASRARLIGLPHPYLVPGDGAMFQEMYYWDSYFMALGLAGTPHEELIVDMAENMASLFRRFGDDPQCQPLLFPLAQPAALLHAP